MIIRQGLTFLLCLSTMALHAQKVSMGPAPAFVQQIDMPPPSGISKYEVEAGYYMALVDMQYDAATQTQYSQFGFEVLTNKGVEEVAQLSVRLDTSYQYMVFHHLLIYREGQVIDRTSEISFELLRQEVGLQNNLYTGVVNAHDILNDVRKGDRLIYAYSVRGENPIFKGHVDWSTFLAGPSAIGRLKVRVILPHDRKYVVDCNRCDGFAQDDKVVGHSRIITVSADKVPQWPREMFIAHHIRPYSSLNISDFTDWASVNRWALDVMHVPPIDTLKPVADRIVQGRTTDEGRIEALIDFVQDEIRYMSMANGIGSHEPRPAGQILGQRFGDCKDKSVLLSGLLRSIGLTDAFPALVNTGSKDLLAHVKPSIHRFDHVIVNFTHQGRTYWIDPVIAEQGGSLDSICVPDHRLALVVRSGTDSLTRIDNHDTYSRVELDETMEFSDYEEDGEYRFVLKNYGLMADMARASIEQVGASDMAEKIRQRLAMVFPGLHRAKDTKISDDSERNILSMTFIYSMPTPWKWYDEAQGKGYSMKYEPMVLYDVLNQFDCAPRLYPMDFKHPTRYSQVTRMKLPRKTSIPVSELFVDNEAFRFSKTVSNLDESTKLIRFSYQSKADEVSVGSYPEVCNEMHDALNGCVTLIIAPTETYIKPSLKSTRTLMDPTLDPYRRRNTPMRH